MREKTIWDKLKSAGLTDAGAAGLMGNLYAESALNPQNLQNSYEKSLGYTDESYTKAVDNGTYANFSKDCAGYGLAQWTFRTRKANLLAFAKKSGKSIGDLGMQLDFLLQELQTDYKDLFAELKSSQNPDTVTKSVMIQFENPADQSQSAITTRATYSRKFYNQYAGTAGRSITEIAQEVITGMWGDGSERKEKLICAGYDYNAVQTEVNKILNQESYTATELGKYFSISVDGKTYSGILAEA
ncbi:MAG: hypothetical protein K2H29_05405 [Oscillospiraceae bacterium]|nr:hypothetical protein [Oscillospiraceae bacterium]